MDELLAATGGRTATIYEYHAGSVAYFTPEAPDFREAGELKGADLAAAQDIFALLPPIIPTELCILPTIVYK